MVNQFKQIMTHVQVSSENNMIKPHSNCYNTSDCFKNFSEHKFRITFGPKVLILGHLNLAMF